MATRKALEIIFRAHPAALTTGTDYPHHCGDGACATTTRRSLHIRGPSLAAASQAYNGDPSGSEGRGQLAVAVRLLSSAAAAGGSRSSYLPVPRRRSSHRIRAQKEQLGGVVRNVIPEFRISADSIDKDVELCRNAYGAEFRSLAQRLPL